MLLRTCLQSQLTPSCSQIHVLICLSIGSRLRIITSKNVGSSVRPNSTNITYLSYSPKRDCLLSMANPNTKGVVHGDQCPHRQQRQVSPATHAGTRGSHHSRTPHQEQNINHTQGTLLKKKRGKPKKPKTAFFPASARPPLNDYPEPGVSAESFTRDYLVLRKMRDFVIPLGREGWHSRQVSATLKPVRYVCTPALT